MASIPFAASAAGSAISSIVGGGQAAGAAKDAAALQARMYDTTRADLLPYNTAGQSVLPDLTALAKSGQFGGGTNYLDQAYQNLPGTMTQSQLQATPGYQFQLGQGLQSVQNSAAAKGLGVSGAALKGAASYATGLADSNYQNQFANQQTKFSDLYNLNTGQQTNLQNQYSRLSGVAGLGENAAAATGQAGTAAAQAGGSALMAAGNASAAGTVGVGNAATGAANSYLQNNFLNQLLAQNSGGSTPAQMASNPVAYGPYNGAY